MRDENNDIKRISYISLIIVFAKFEQYIKQILIILTLQYCWKTCLLGSLYRNFVASVDFKRNVKLLQIARRGMKGDKMAPPGSLLNSEMFSMETVF